MRTFDTLLHSFPLTLAAPLGSSAKESGSDAVWEKVGELLGILLVIGAVIWFWKGGRRSK